METFLKTITRSILLLIHFGNIAHSQPYIPTYVENSFFKQNSFKAMKADMSIPPKFETVKDKLPLPVWNARTDVINCYWRTWEIAFSNLKSVNNESGFVSPYIDPAFNEHIFMWDCSFMTMFGKYARHVFNFQNTLNNFYAKQHPDGFICREIRESDGTDLFERFDPASTGPNIMPWAEWEYFLNFNDTGRLAKVFPVLLSYYQWFKTYRSWPDGTYYSSGWGCGMDNQPRVPENYNPAFSHGFMSWIDITLQQVFAGNILIEMANKLNRQNDVNEIETEINKLKNIVNTKMWDNRQKYYFDRYRDGSLNNLKSIAAFWALLAEVVPDDQMQGFIHHLEDSTEFARTHRVPTLSADDPDFDPNGGYWKGSIWAPTNYMVLRGLTKNGLDSLAYEIAYNHLGNVVEVFNQTKDLRENYAPDKVQGNDRHNFVGWTGLVPINVLLEYVFGIRANVPENTLLIDIHLTDEYGVKQYPFGNDGMIDILCKKRKNESERPSVNINTNIPLKIIIKWKGGKFEKNIPAGKMKI